MFHPPADQKAGLSSVHTATAKGELILCETAQTFLSPYAKSPCLRAARLAASKAAQSTSRSESLVSCRLSFTILARPCRIYVICHTMTCGDASSAALAGVSAALLCLQTACRSIDPTAILRDIRLLNGSSQAFPRTIAISGVKNSGKTTLIASILPYLRQAGCSTAVIKHDGHSFDADPPNTDTGKYMAAGAVGTAIFDAGKYKSIHRRTVDEQELLALFPEADLILLEGFKHSTWPKLEVVRGAVSSHPVCKTDNLLAVVTDLPLPLRVSVLPLNDPPAVAQFILNYCFPAHTNLQHPRNFPI